MRAVLRVLDILDVLQDSAEGASLADVARATRLPRSSAFRYLATLEARGYVERDPARGDYRLGLALRPLRTQYLEVLAARARPYLDELRGRFAETLNLGALDGTAVAYLEILESPQAVRFVARRGGRDPLHSTALGKAIAAHLPEEQVRRILAAAGMERRTPRTIVEPEDFLRELDQVRARGYAVDDQENEREGRCVAVGVTGSRIPAAISLSSPAGRLPPARVEDVAAALRRSAGQLAAEVGRA